METLQVIGQECGIASNVWANHGVTICVCVMFLLLTYSERFQNFRPHLSEEQRLRVALEVYNAALALDGGTKRFLHALQDMRNRSTMAPCFWMGAGCSMLWKNKMSTIYMWCGSIHWSFFIFRWREVLGDPLNAAGAATESRPLDLLLPGMRQGCI